MRGLVAASGVLVLALLCVSCAATDAPRTMGGGDGVDDAVIDNLRFTDVGDNGCGDASFGRWMKYEMDQGDNEALNSNSAKPSAKRIIQKSRQAPLQLRDQSSKLLCITYTYVKANHKAAVLHNSWGKYCTRHVIVTNQGPIEGVPDEDVLVMTPEGGEDNHNLWRKTQAIVHRLSQKDGGLADYDFYFMGGDDVTMYPPNLQYVFSEPGLAAMHRAGAPLFLGTRFESPSGIFLSGAGYVFNTPVLHLLNQAFRRKRCSASVRTHAEDLYIAKCLQLEFAVDERDTKDAQGEDRVIVMTAEHMATQAHDPAYTWWFRDFKKWHAPRGMDIVSRHPVCFHYTPPNDVLELTRKTLG